MLFGERYDEKILKIKTHAFASCLLTVASPGFYVVHGAVRCMNIWMQNCLFYC